MPESAQFEEREYETPLYHELTSGHSNLWTPGNVLEKHLGFDAALDVAAHPIWNLIGDGSVPAGTRLGHVHAIVVARGNDSVRRLPDFKVNLFIQAKRPEWMQYRTRGLADTSLASPYWRFGIREEQQACLEAVADGVGANGEVLYAAPAFHTMEDFVRHVSSNTVSRNSTYVDPSMLTDHEYWAYEEPGTEGFACSDPKFVSGERIGALIERLSTLATIHEVPSADVAADSISKMTQAILANAERVLEGTVRFEAFRALRPELGEIYTDRFPTGVSAYLELRLFLRVFNISWFVIG